MFIYILLYWMFLIISAIILHFNKTENQKIYQEIANKFGSLSLKDSEETLKKQSNYFFKNNPKSGFIIHYLPIIFQIFFIIIYFLTPLFSSLYWISALLILFQVYLLAELIIFLYLKKVYSNIEIKIFWENYLNAQPNNSLKVVIEGGYYTPKSNFLIKNRVVLIIAFFVTTILSQYIYSKFGS